MADIQPTDVLFIPNRRRLTHAFLKSPEGQNELHIFYGIKEIIIDEPDLMTFGDKLMKVEKFKAEEATTWTSDAPQLDWERVRGLLDALLGEEILKRFDESQVKAHPEVRSFPPTLGRNPEGRKPETYTAKDAGKCPHIAQRVFGREIELENLEVVLPIHRVAHPALDTDGRQVGENNVNDKLFLDLPTERRLCNYAGSRYHHDQPINATALKHMTRRWPELLSLTESFRTAFFKKLPPRGPALIAGEVHLLAVCQLASLGYVMVRGENPTGNGELDAGLAASFRLIDGVRICTTDMVRDTAGVNGCLRPANARIIHDYAEQNSLFLDKWGVCAGPAALIDEYLGVLLEGSPAPIQADPSLEQRLGDVNAAIEYGLHGIRLEAMVRILGSWQGDLHQRLHAAFVKHSAPPTKLGELLAIPIDRVQFQFLRILHPLPETFAMEERVGSWFYERAAEGLPKPPPGIPERISDLRKLDAQARTSQQHKLAEFLSVNAPDFQKLPEALRVELVAVAVEFFALERAVLRAVGAEQQWLNDLLKRKSGRKLTSDDLAAYDRRCTPVFGRVFGEGLGLTVGARGEGTFIGAGPNHLHLID